MKAVWTCSAPAPFSQRLARAVRQGTQLFHLHFPKVLLLWFYHNLLSFWPLCYSQSLQCRLRDIIPTGVIFLGNLKNYARADLTLGR